MSDLGRFLKKLRGGLSLREAAKRSGLSYTYIGSLESGKHPRTGEPIKPSPETLRSLSDAYNYSYDELMKIAGYIDTNDDKKGLTQSRTEYVIKEMVEKYNIDLNEPGKVKELERIIQFVFDAQKNDKETP